MSSSSHYRDSPYVGIPEPVLEEGRVGKMDYPIKFREYSADTITLEDIVSAVLPDSQFLGNVVTIPVNPKEQASKRNNKQQHEAFSASVISAEDQLEEALKVYGVQLATIPHWVESKRGELRSSNPRQACQFPPITGHRRNVRNGEGSLMACYYCKRCLDLRGFECGDPGRVKFALVVVGRIRKVDTGDSSNAQASLTVEKLFPHDRQCFEGNRDMCPTSFLDRTRFGSGALLVDFPLKEIVGKTMARLVEQFKERPPNRGGVPVGDQIFPDAEEGGMRNRGKYMFDYRFYMKLPSEEDFVRKVLSPTDFRMMMVATWYWIAGKFSLSNQMYELQLKKFSVGAGNNLYPTWPPVEEEIVIPHLFLSDVSGLWGGHQKGNHATPVDQVLHVDIPEVRVRSEDTVDHELYTVTTNPDLQGKMRPGSCLVPLMDFRDLCTVRENQKYVDRVSKDQMLYFSGDYCHGGKTYLRSDESHHLCIHFYLNSYFHQKKNDHIGLVTEANALHGQEHARYLNDIEIDDMMAVLKVAQKRLDHASKLNKEYTQEKSKKIAGKRKKN
jgi:hypothetical protein